MLRNIPGTILHDMDKLVEVRAEDTKGVRLAAVANFLGDAAAFFAKQHQLATDLTTRHNAGILTQGFAAGKAIVEHASSQS